MNCKQKEVKIVDLIKLTQKTSGIPAKQNGTCSGQCENCPNKKKNE